MKIANINASTKCTKASNDDCISFVFGNGSNLFPCFRIRTSVYNKYLPIFFDTFRYYVIQNFTVFFDILK